MARLTGPQMAQLLEAMLATFDRQALGELLLFRLNRNIDEIISPDEDLREATTTIIKEANQEGWIGDLLHAVAEARPKVASLQTFVAALLVQVETPSPAPVAPPAREFEEPARSAPAAAAAAPAGPSRPINTSQIALFGALAVLVVAAILFFVLRPGSKKPAAGDIAPPSTAAASAPPAATTQPTARPTETPAPAVTAPTATMPPTATEEPMPEALATSWQALTPPPAALTLAEPIQLELVRVPGGSFTMGSDKAKDPLAADDELPQGQVNVAEFYIGKYEVTNTQYAAFVKATGHTPPTDWENGAVPEGKADSPVKLVSWKDALAFTDWLSAETGKPFGLPTEAEWEKACRGVDARLYPWGNEPDVTLANYAESVGGRTAVGSYSPQGDSPYGVADMAGNLWEWTSTLYAPYPYLAMDGREDLNAPGKSVLRGGGNQDDAKYIRCAVRGAGEADEQADDIGFRVAVSP